MRWPTRLSDTTRLSDHCLSDHCLSGADAAPCRLHPAGSLPPAAAFAQYACR